MAVPYSSSEMKKGAPWSAGALRNSREYPPLEGSSGVYSLTGSAATSAPASADEAAALRERGALFLAGFASAAAS